jgi:hypothetical protein
MPIVFGISCNILAHYTTYVERRMKLSAHNVAQSGVSFAHNADYVGIDHPAST